MPRAKQQTAFLGEQTVRILLAVPQNQAGWLIHALCDWIENDNEPDASTIPPECIGSWVAIHDESVRIHDAKKQAKEAGSIGGKANVKRTSSERQANGERKGSKIEIENKIESSPSNEVELLARAPAFEGEASCPLDEDTIRVTAAHIGMPEAEVDAWRDYYTAAQWRFRPADPRPMTPSAALASLKRWHVNEGIRKAREEHLDAKMDERAAKRDAARNGILLSTSDIEERDRKRKAEEAAALAHAKELMNW